MAAISPDMILPDVEARFWAKVERRGPDECWPWIGAKIPKDGRGTFYLSRRQTSAPRVAIVIAQKSSLGQKDFACHSCDNPNCVNPNHLWVGSNSANLRDASQKKRLPAQQKTHCVNGHAFAGYNLLFNKRGQRQCRTCKNAQARDYKARQALGETHDR